MPYPTNELVQRCWTEICDVAATIGKQLSHSFGNFDKLVGAGWLMGDVIQGRLIDRADAFAVGRKIGKLAPTLKVPACSSQLTYVLLTYLLTYYFTYYLLLLLLTLPTAECTSR